MKPKPVKFWLAIASNPLFTPNDRCTFRVGMCKSYDDIIEPGDTQFFDGKNIEVARRAMYKQVDEWCTRYQEQAIREGHEDYKEEKLAVKKEKFKEKAAGKEIVADRDVNSLSIGGFVNVKEDAPVSLVEELRETPKKPAKPVTPELGLTIHNDEPVKPPKKNDDIGLLDLGLIDD